MTNQLRNKAKGIRFRLITLFVLIFGTTTLLFSLFVYYYLNQSLLKDFDIALYNYGVDISETFEIDLNYNLELRPININEDKIYPFQSGETFLIIRESNGKILARGSNAQNFDPEYKQYIHFILSGNDSAFDTINHLATPDSEDYSYRLMTFPIDNKGKTPLYMQIAAPMTTFDTQLKSMKSLLLWGLPAVLLIAIFAGLYLIHKTLKPIQNMIDQTHLIKATNLKQRLLLPRSQDEIKELALTINSMLARIETAFESQENFIANASHQLLTPITIMKGEIEIYLLNESDANKRILFNSLLYEIDSLTRIVQSMLLLAQIESGQNILNLALVDPTDIVLDLIPQFKKTALNKNIHIKYDVIQNSDQVFCNLDTGLIKQLLSNLIDNAIKYSFNNGQIYIRSFWQTDGVKIEIEDFGQGIPEHIQPILFNHFTRANTSSSIQGYGLGLSIAQKIAKIHRTQIEILKKDSPGALFSILFKANQLK